MDKELRERIGVLVGSAVAVYVSNYRTQPTTFIKTLRDNTADQILALIKESRKVSGEPVIISHKQIDVLLNSYNPAIREHDARTFALEVANVQRDADVRFYTT